MADSDAQPERRIIVDTRMLLPLSLVGVIVMGGVQYGRQSERLDRVVTDIATMQAKLTEMSLAISKLNPTTTAGR